MSLKNRKDDWDSSFTEEDYLVGTEDGQYTTLRFLCPGCGALLGVSSRVWELVDVNTLTVRASILHMRPHGCGWHGYLTNGILEGKIE